MLIKNILKAGFQILQPIENDGNKFSSTLSLKKRIIKIFKKDKILYSNFYKEIFFLLKHFILYIIAILYLPIIIIFILQKKKIVLINTDQIGAYLHQLDCLSKYSKLNNIEMVFFSSKIFNKFHELNFHFEKCIRIFDSSILYILTLPMTVINNITINPWQFEALNENSEYNKIHSDYKLHYNKYNIDFDFDFTETKNYLNSNSLNEKNFVCIVLKDQYYNYSSVRDVKLNDYLLSIDYLIQKNINVIRFINNKSPKFEISSNKYFELNVEINQNNLIQLGLIQKALFVICNQSGVSNYNTLSKTPYLLSNAIPINIINVIKNTDRFTIKKFYDLKTNKYLNFKEIFSLKLHLYPEIFSKKNQIKIIDNSEIEILDSVKKMLSNKKSDESFLDQFKDIPGFYTHSKMPENFKVSEN